MKKAGLRFFVVFAFCMLALAFGVGTAQAEKVRIGVIYNLTGKMAPVDKPSYEGMLLALQQINAAGGVLGEPLELVVRDGKSDTREVARVAAELVREQGVHMVIGLNDTTYVLSAAPEVLLYNIPFLTPGATLPSLPRFFGPFFFMAAFGDDTQARAISKFARRDLGAKTSWVLTDNALAFTRNLTKFYLKRFVKYGGIVVGEQLYQTGATNFNRQMEGLAAIRPQPDTIFISAISPDVKNTVEAVRSRKHSQPILSGDGFDTDQLEAIDSGYAHDIYYATHVSYESPKPVVVRFVHDFEAMYKRKPDSSFAALGYDSLNLAVDAIKRAKTTLNTAIRSNLAATHGFEGVAGDITYRPGSREPEKPVTIIRYQDGDKEYAGEIQPN